MKKKLLLVPIILMMPLMSSCTYDTPLVTVGEWVDHNGYMRHKPSFSIQNIKEEESGWSLDYDDVVSDIIKGKIYEAEFLGENLPKKKKETTDVFVCYSIDCHLRQMNTCQIFIYDNGFINSVANGDSTIWGSPKTQDASYRISVENAESIIEKATERLLEIKEVQERERDEIFERAKLENIFARAEENKEKLELRNRGTGPIYRVYETNDENLEYLNLLKEVDYEKRSISWYYDKERLGAITYGIEEDFHIHICYDATDPDNPTYDAVVVTVAYKETYPSSGMNNYFYYEIDQTVGKQLVNKAYEILNISNEE